MFVFFGKFHQKAGFGGWRIACTAHNQDKASKLLFFGEEGNKLAKLRRCASRMVISLSFRSTKYGPN